MLRYKRELAWFSHLVRHPARKQSGSILTTPDPAQGAETGKHIWKGLTW